MRSLLAAVVALLLAVSPAFARDPMITDGRNTSDPAPLVIILHGFTSSGASMRRRTNFDAVAKQHGFVVAYPSGPRRRCDDRSATSADVASLTALITTLIAQGVADPAHIYLAGHSNGGAIALRMACARPDLVSAIAVVAMNAPSKPHCDMPQPMPTIFIHGTDDPIVPPAGLTAKGRIGGIASVTQTLTRWSTRNRCTGPFPPRVFNQTGGTTTATFTRYANCAKPLLHISLSGHGHEWPGAGPRARWIQGPASFELDAADAIWKFFKNP